MGKTQKTDIQNPNLINILGFAVLAILIIVSIIYMYDTTSKLNTKIDSLNKSLELESEDHYINVQNDIAKSVVMVLSAPAHTDGTSNNNVIYLDNEGGAWNLGTGFSIDDKGDILTADHVVTNASDVVVEYNDGSNSKMFTVYGIRHVPELDLAILYVNTPIPPVKLQDGNFDSSRVGSSVAFIGFPLTTPLDGKNYPVQTSVKGSVSSIVPFTYKNDKVPVYILGGTANHGNSGGPVFSLKTGEVIGIINQKIVGTEGITISTAVNQNLVNSLLKLGTTTKN